MKQWLLAASMVLLCGVTMAGEVKVAVAANFAATFAQIAEHFKIKNGHSAIASLGSTGALYAQIMNGAPYELFLSADAVRPRELVEQGKGVDGTCMSYAIGRLILWSSNPTRVDAEGALLKSGFSGRLAIANPATAPYGLAAQQTLEHLGQWNVVQKSLVRGQNIAQTFQFAASGSVDAAFISLSQIKSGDYVGRGSYWLVPQTLHDPIDQKMVLLKKGKNNPAAQALLAFITSAEGRKIISDDGYGISFADHSLP